MQALKQFSLPIIGMKIGFHHFNFVLNESYFEAFENSPVSDGAVNAELKVEKKYDHLVLDLDLKGHVQLECSRCIDEISFPVTKSYDFLVKYDDNPREEDEVIYLEPDNPEFNCAKLIHDMVVLSLPIRTTCDDVEGKTCDEEVLKRLNNETKEEDAPAANPLSEALKNIKLD